jgi:nucleoside-diphosphate-sugar epimerase
VEANVVHAAWQAGVQRLLFLGSSCIYPRDCPQPIKEEYLLTGPLEQTNEPYAIAKIAGVKLCEPPMATSNSPICGQVKFPQGDDRNGWIVTRIESPWQGGWRLL